MLQLSQARRVVVVGGGTAGWFASLEMRQTFPSSVEVVLIESEQIGIIGAGEGSIPNLNLALQRYGIERNQFMAETESTVKLGVCFEGWRRAADCEDRYYHLFSTLRGDTSLLDWCERGFYPLSSCLMAQGTPLDQFASVQGLIESQASQDDVLAWLDGHPREAYGYHFDARALARFLRKEAERRGVRRIEGEVRRVVVHGDSQRVSGLETDAGLLTGDFFVDASGMRRLIVGESLGVRWKSFAPHLILDAALPFMMPHEGKHPPLVTLSRAMRNGWMWVIPTRGRLGCGYVYSTAHANEQEILDELQSYWHADIAPVNRIRFDPGCLERCLLGNVLAVGLCSGFVEPLEATSIAHTLYQLSFFGNLMRDTNWTVADQSIDLFNQEVRNAWNGIVDFLVMHYDTQRNDTTFWKDAASAARPKRYQELKDLFAARTPRYADLVPYQMGGTLLFGIPSWESVGFAMGVIPKEAAASQLAQMSPSAWERLARHMGHLPWAEQIGALSGSSCQR